jgi:hypothetical protein
MSQIDPVYKELAGITKMENSETMQMDTGEISQYGAGKDSA